MIGNPITNSRPYRKMLDKWRSLYCMILPVAAVGAYLLCYKKWGIKVWNSDNFTETLTSMITFVSIIISFFGVLLTILISAKEKSKLIHYFLASADKEDFVASIKRLIMYGLLTVIFAAVLFIKDIMAEKVILIFLCCGIFALIKFTTLTYRFTNILLMLFIEDRDSVGKREGTKLPESEKREMDERIRKGI